MGGNVDVRPPGTESWLRPWLPACHTQCQWKPDSEVSAEWRVTRSRWRRLGLSRDGQSDFPAQNDSSYRPTLFLNNMTKMASYRKQKWIPWSVLWVKRRQSTAVYPPRCLPPCVRNLLLPPDLLQVRLESIMSRSTSLKMHQVRSRRKISLLFCSHHHQQSPYAGSLRTWASLHAQTIQLRRYRLIIISHICY